MDNLPVTPKEAGDLLHAFNETRTTVLIILVVVLIVVLAFLLIRQRMEASAKNARSQKLTTALDNLAASMREHTERDNETMLTVTGALDAVEATNESLNHSITRLVAATNGTLSRPHSMRQIKTGFLRMLHTDACVIAERSLTDNHYDQRPKFIAERVRTRLADLMSELRAELKSYPLSVDVEPFFEAYVSPDGGERFALVDLMWDCIEPAYSRDGTLRERVDEVTLALENTIKDYFTRAFNSIRLAGEPMPTTMSESTGRTPPKGHRALGALSEKMRTPRPG